MIFEIFIYILTFYYISYMQNISNINNIPTISIPVCAQLSPSFYSKHSNHSNHSLKTKNSSSSSSSNDFDWPETFGIEDLLQRMNCPYDILDTIFPELINGRTKRGELRKLKQKTIDVIREVSEYITKYNKQKNIANAILEMVTDLQKRVKKIIKTASLHRQLNDHQSKLNK